MRLHSRLTSESPANRRFSSASITGPGLDTEDQRAALRFSEQFPRRFQVVRVVRFLFEGTRGEIEKATFPWAASGRALSLGRKDGLTKLIFSKQTHRLLGAGIVGKNAGELIAEILLAMELGADSEDLALTIHPHPTLSETVGFAAEMVEGTITDLYAPKRR